ncbi:retrovirus-related pol polyprotein from transposon TNT 1-94 [Tanacetum coccineum]
MITPRVRDVYVLDMNSLVQQSCFFAKASESLNWLWHKRLAHLNFRTINKLAKQNLFLGLPSLVYSKEKPCPSCEKGKHYKASFKIKQTSSIKKYLNLLHMDLFGPVTPRSINHENYTLVIVDEYSRYTWVYVLKKKSHAPKTIMSFIKIVENQNDIKVKQLRTDNGTEFKNHILVNFCDRKGILENFYSPYTPKQNGVVERKNRTLIEATRTILLGSIISKQYRAEAVATTCYTHNRSTIVKRHLKTPYEIFCRRLPNIYFLHVFGYPVFIHNHKDHLGKFDEKADDGYFLGYSLVSKAFRLMISTLLSQKDTHLMNIFIPLNLHKADASLDQNDQADQGDQADQSDQSDQADLNDQNDHPVQITEPPSSSTEDASTPNAVLTIQTESPLSIPSMSSLTPQDRWSKDKHIELVNIVGNLGAGMLTRAMAKELSATLANECLFVDFLSEEEPKKIYEALKHPGWVDAMQGELNQFSRFKV